MAAAKQTTAVVTKDQALPPADWGGYDDYAGQGMEDVGQEDKGLPFFEIIQKNSPEVEEIEGAKPGMIVNKSTGELFESIRIIPCCRDRLFVEWKPLDAGGGLIAQHDPASEVVEEALREKRVGKHILPNGNELIETFYLYVMVLDADDEPTPGVIAFKSTGIGSYKQLMTRSDSLMFRGKDGAKRKFPLFAHVWKLTTKKQQKDAYTWHNWVVQFDCTTNRAEDARLQPTDPVQKALLDQASDIVAAHRQGAMKLDTSGLKNAGEAGGGRSSGAGDPDDAPF